MCVALIKAGEFHNEHPIKGISKLKQRVSEIGFLNTSEIKQLLGSLSGEELHIAKLCLPTGARWSEAAELKGSDIVHGRVTFSDTKNGKNGTVPITTELMTEIHHDKSSRLFNSDETITYAHLPPDYLNETMELNTSIHVVTKLVLISALYRSSQLCRGTIKASRSNYSDC